MSTDSRRMSKVQKDVIVEFVKQNPELRMKTVNNHFTQAKSRELWECITDKLNSLEGPTKTYDQWRKTWHDYKRNSIDGKRKLSTKRKTEEDGDPLNLVDNATPTCSKSMPSEVTKLTLKRLHLEQTLQDLTDSNLQRQEQEEEYRQKKLLYLDEIVREKKRKNDLEEKKIAALEKIADSLISLSDSYYQKM